jgi:uncharacterized protein YllA (UPF0747 family)
VTPDLLPWDALAPGRRLFLAHLRGDRAARDLFGGRGCDDAAVAGAAEQRRRSPLPHREDLARAVTAYLAGHDAPAASLEAAARLADPRAVAILGGQQPAVAGGPLLAFAKAAGVVALARRLEAAGAGPVVPVWWVASEDHDLAEAGAVRLAPRLRGADLLGADSRDRRMLRRVPAPFTQAPAEVFGSGEFLAAVAPLFLNAPEEDLGTASARVLLRLLGDRGLVVVEPQIVAPFAGHVFAADVRSPGTLAAAVREGNARVRAAGFEPVLEDPRGPLHFRVDPQGRRTRGGGTEEDLRDPANRLSSDVALRVLVQDAALPTAAQVSGPTELEYLAAIHPARAAAGVFAPCPVARPGVTVLERRVEQGLEEFGADLLSLYRDGADALRGPGPATDDPLAEGVRRAGDALDAAAGGEEGLPAAVRSRLGRARDALRDLEAAAGRAAAERRGVGESRRRRILDALLPDGEPQERRWSLLPFLLRHGPGLWGKMVDALSGPEPGHRVIRT